MAIDDDVAAAGAMSVACSNFDPFAAAAAVNVVVRPARRRRNAHCANRRRMHISMCDHCIAIRAGNGNDPAIVSQDVATARTMAMSASDYDIPPTVPIVPTARSADVALVNVHHGRRRWRWRCFYIGE